MTATGRWVELEDAVGGLEEAHPGEIARHVVTFGQAEPWQVGLLSSGDRSRHEQPDHPVGIDPSQVPRIEEAPLPHTADDVVEEAVDRPMIQRPGYVDDVQSDTSRVRMS